MSLLFFIPLVSWFWSDDQSMWLRFVRIKFPLFLFPLAFAGSWQLSPKQWRWIAYFFVLLVFAGCCWSIGNYLQNIDTIHQQYLKAKLIPTPLENDHVRFSLLVTIAIVCLVVLIQQGGKKAERIIATLCVVLFIAYLHILSARTGLITFYLFLFCSVFYLLSRLKRSKWIIVLSVLIVALPLAAWFFLPTFQNRVKYNLYDLSNAKQNKYIPGSNDGNRILSLKAGCHVLQEHPWGTGADIVQKTFDWYDRNVPEMMNSEKLFPSSEPLMYAGFAGWPGIVLFFAIMLLPFFQRTKINYFFWVILNLSMAFSFLFDIGLEAQFGVFIYAFITLWWRKWFELPHRNKAHS